MALVYFLAGKLALLLAIPPGYATAVWPAAGLALAGTLILGNGVWPGIWLGSFLVNISTGWDATTGPTIVKSLSVAAGIGIGAALQAWVGAFLVRRTMTLPTAFLDEWEVVKFIGWGGVIACLVNATVGASVLWGMGIIPINAIAFSWWTWWVGDAIGVCLVTPIILLWDFQQQQQQQQQPVTPRRIVSVSFPVMILVGLMVGLFIYASRVERDQIRHVLHKHVQVVANELQKDIQNYRDVLHAISGLYASSNEVDWKEFRTFVSDMFSRYPGFQALSWNPFLTDRDRSAFETGLRQEGHPHFSIVELNPQRQLVKAARRPEYVAVTYIEPWESNTRAFGLDVWADPVRREALERARDKGDTQTTRKLRLVQNQEGEEGVILYRPIYRKGAPPQTVEERRRHLQGYVAGMFRLKELWRISTQEVDLHHIDVMLIDQSASGEGRLLLGGITGLGVEASLEAVHERKGMMAPETFSFDVAGHPWSLQFFPTLAYWQAQRSFEAWGMLLGGLLISVLLVAFLLVVTGRTARVEELVTQRSGELKYQNQVIQSILNTLREGVVVADEKGVMTWFNPVAEHTLGVGATEASPERWTETYGVFRSDQVTPVPMQELPLVQALNGKTVENVELFVRNPKKPEGVFISINGTPLKDEIGRLKGGVVSFRDVTERKKLERMKDEFLAMVSHELRTPLASIYGTLQMLVGGVGGELSERAKQLVEIANRNSQRLTRLINDLLDLQKMEAGKMIAKVSKMELVAVIRRAVESMHGYGEKFQVTYDVQSEVTEAFVQGDDDRVTQVVVNLLSNATKVSPPQSQVIVTIARRHDRVRVSVTDRGPGIPEDFRSKMFQKFSQADSSTRRQQGGTGLGLSVSKLLMEQMGGAIGFEAVPQGGTTFYLELPEWVEHGATS